MIDENKIAAGVSEIWRTNAMLEAAVRDDLRALRLTLTSGDPKMCAVDDMWDELWPDDPNAPWKQAA